MIDYDKYYGRVYLVKEHEGLIIGRGYTIKGQGDLKWNADKRVNGKTGYGYCIEDDWVKEKTWYYFTYDEMEKYFITDEENYKMYQRDSKIEEIIR
jgi:hypothetical protein